jgi:hypothetical protein
MRPLLICAGGCLKGEVPPNQRSGDVASVADGDGYLAVFAHLREGARHEIEVARKLNLPQGLVVVIDRGFIDYRPLSRWTEQGIFFVTWIKGNADYWPEKCISQSDEDAIRQETIGWLNRFVAGAWLEAKSATNHSLG